MTKITTASLCRLMAAYLLLVLSACSGNNNSNQDDSYISWKCDGNKQADNWECRLQRMRDGRYVGPVEQVTASLDETSVVVTGSDANGIKESVQGQAKVSPEVPVDNGLTMTGQTVAAHPPEPLPQTLQRDSNWRKQLPGMDNSLVVTDSSQPAKPAVNRVNRRNSPRTPESAFPDIRAESGKSVVYEPKDSVPQKAMAPQSKPPVDRGFTIQLCAFLDASGVQRFLDQQGLYADPFNAYTVESGGRQWHVLTWGQFETYADAEISWHERMPHVDVDEVWIRSFKSLQNAGAFNH